MERLISPQEVADTLGICTKTLSRLVRAGKMRYVQVTARKRMFKQVDIDEFIENNIKMEPESRATSRRTHGRGNRSSSAKVIGFMKRLAIEAKRKKR